MKERSTAFGQRFPARRLIPFLALPLAFLLWPSAAYADGGLPFILPLTPFTLFWTVVLGAVEGILIAVVFRVRKIVALGVMVGANYVSMFVGILLLGPLRSFVFGHFMKGAPLYDMPRLQWILFGLSFAITLVVEWPFCLLLVRRKRGRWWKSVLATGLAQTASYALLIPVFLYITEHGLYGQVDVDPSFVPSISDDAFVYFLSPDDGDVYRVRLNGQNREKVLTLGARAVNGVVASPILFVRQGEDGRHVDLWEAVAGVSDWRRRMVLPTVGVLPFPGAYDGEKGEYWVNGQYSGEAPVLDFRSPQNRAWNVHMRRYGASPFSAENGRTGESLQLSSDTPFLYWDPSRVNVIPGDKVVFELAGEPPNVPDEIVLLDLHTRKLGLITYGRSPVVVFPEESAPVADAGKLE